MNRYADIRLVAGRQEYPLAGLEIGRVATVRPQHFVDRRPAIYGQSADRVAGHDLITHPPLRRATERDRRLAWHKNLHPRHQMVVPNAIGGRQISNSRLGGRRQRAEGLAWLHSIEQPPLRHLATHREDDTVTDPGDELRPRIQIVWSRVDKHITCDRTSRIEIQWDDIADGNRRSLNVDDRQAGQFGNSACLQRVQLRQDHGQQHGDHHSGREEQIVPPGSLLGVAFGFHGANPTPLLSL